jgi:AAA+ ATPase superfamily predicted ATPase
MSNPYQRPASGSYKSVLIEGLKKIGETKLAEEFSNGNLKFALTSTIYGNVKTLPELSSICESALSSLEQNDVIGYYLWQLKNKECVVASTNNVFVYDPADKVAVAYNERMKNISEREIINPFFTS